MFVLGALLYMLAMEPCAIKKDSEGYQNDYIYFFFHVDIRELEI